MNSDAPSNSSGVSSALGFAASRANIPQWPHIVTSACHKRLSGICPSQRSRSFAMRTIGSSRASASFVRESCARSDIQFQ